MPKYKQPSEGKLIAQGLIDSEYEALLSFTADDLWTYLKEYKPCMDRGLSREESDELYKTFFGKPVIVTCPDCRSDRIDPTGRGGWRCCSCGNTFGAD